MRMLQSYITLAIIFVVAISVLYLPILLILRKKGIGIIRQLGGLFWFCSVFLILFATIIFAMPFNLSPTYRTFNITLFYWVNYPNPMHRLFSEVVPNVLMFIPFGIFTPVVFKKMRKFYKMAVLALLLTVGIEVTQYFIGRTADINDVLANFIGGVVGYGVFMVARRLFENKGWGIRFVGE